MSILRCADLPLAAARHQQAPIEPLPRDEPNDRGGWLTLPEDLLPPSPARPGFSSPSSIQGRTSGASRDRSTCRSGASRRHPGRQRIYEGESVHSRSVCYSREIARFPRMRPRAGCVRQYIPPIPEGMAGVFVSVSHSTTTHSVVSSSPATDPVFCSALRVTVIGSENMNQRDAT